MSFTDTQLRLLKARLNPVHVRSRTAEGQILSYLEGWHVIAEANRIFGFDGWSRETSSLACVFTRQMGERYLAAYTAKVRITVRAGEHLIVREGSGAGEANVTSPGQAHEVASKAAETDATKRALMTFGNAFGLSLYKGVLEPEARCSGREQRISAPQSSNGLAAKGSPQAAEAQAMSMEPRQEVPNAADQARSAVDTNAARFSGAVAVPPALKPEVDGVPAELPVAAGTAGSADHRPQTDPHSLPVAAGRPRIDKSALTLAEPRRIRDQDHLRFVASHPCLLCGRLPAQAHHLKFTQSTALSRKVSDEYTVPLCALHHRELHAAGNERMWWQARKLDPLTTAQDLWQQSRRRVTTTAPDESPLNGSTFGW